MGEPSIKRMSENDAAEFIRRYWAWKDMHGKPLNKGRGVFIRKPASPNDGRTATVEGFRWLPGNMPMVLLEVLAKGGGSIQDLEWVETAFLEGA